MSEVQSLLWEHLLGTMLFVPTDKVNLYTNEDDDNEVCGLIVAIVPIEG